MTGSAAGLPAVSSDLLLMHAPAVFEFRECTDRYWPFMCSGGSELITPLYEVPPVGFRSLQRYLRERGHGVELLNLSTLLLRFPDIDLASVFDALDTPLVGIDLHWLIHVQGALEVADRLKRHRSDIRIVFGGISSTIFARSLIEYPQVDFVMRGYDTHSSMDQLLREMKGQRRWGEVPNLAWKDGTGVRDNGYTHKPATLASGMDLSDLPYRASGLAPIRDVLTIDNTGCVHNCGWCGGSRSAFRRINETRRPLVPKSLEDIERELDSLGHRPDLPPRHLYTLGTYSEPRKRFSKILDSVSRSTVRSVMYDHFFLPSPEVVDRMVATDRKVTVNLSPQSHDREISRLSGRGTYGMAEMEAWIEMALGRGVDQIEVYFFVGMPQQDTRSVLGTVDYCEGFLDRFRDSKVSATVCPMFPFLDPASEYAVAPEKWGYRVLRRTLEEHRTAMLRASHVQRGNYETQWLSRRELVDVSYRAMRDLLSIKVSLGKLPEPLVKDTLGLLEDARSFVPVVDEADTREREPERRAALSELSDEILRRNRIVFGTRVTNQAFPIQREIGGRWFDDIPWDDDEVIASSVGTPNA